MVALLNVVSRFLCPSRATRDAKSNEQSRCNSKCHEKRVRPHHFAPLENAFIDIGQFSLALCPLPGSQRGPQRMPAAPDPGDGLRPDQVSLRLQQVGSIIRILKGEKPADLPVQQTTAI